MSARLALVALCLCLLAGGPLSAQSDVARMNESAWRLLQRGETADAAKLFADALESEPDNPVLLLGAGVAAHVQGHGTNATAYLRRALQLAPDLTPASILLGQIAHQNGDVTQAISIYENALSYAPDEPQLTNSLKAWRAEAEVDRELVERRVDRFRVMFQGRTDTALAHRVTDLLESAFWRIGKALGAYPSDPVVVMLYTEKQFRDITQAPEWAGGLYDGRIRVPTAGAARRPQLFERVLVHELAHAMIASLAPRGVPVWLHEGLAQHFEGDDPAAARRRLNAFGQVIPLRHLEGSFSHLTAEQALLAYDESLVVADAIVQRAGLDWSALFRALAESGRPEYTLDGFGLRYSELETEIAIASGLREASPSR